MTLVRGDFFNLRGGGGLFLSFFKKNIFISPKCLIMQCIFAFTILQLLHNSLHTAQACFRELYVRWPFTPGSHILRLQCVCSPCAEAARTHCAFTKESAPDLWLFTTNTFIHYFDFKCKHCYWKCFFSIVILFLHSAVLQSFIDVFKHNKYKKHIIQCFFLLHFWIYILSCSSKWQNI